MDDYPLRIKHWFKRCGPWVATALFSLSFTGCGSPPPAAETRQLAPGVFYHKVSLIEGPWAVHVLEVALEEARRAGWALRLAGASDGSTARTSQLAAGLGGLAAVNGDFFVDDDGQPVRTTGMHISAGEIVRVPHGLSAFALDREGRPLIGVFSFAAGIAIGERVFPIGSFNRGPGRNELALYNRFAAATADSVHAAFGLRLQRIAGESVVNDTVVARVVQVRRRAWPLRLDEDQWLVAAGRDVQGLDVAPGDTVRLFSSLPPAATSLREAIGGGPRIVRDGGVSVEDRAEHLSRQFAAGRYPRTALGHSRDGATVFMVTVDGRQPGYSVGMSLEELARFMCRGLSAFSRSGANVHQALNLDGGGSTTMVVQGEVVNRPSDPTGESAVANALVLAPVEL